MNTKTKNITVVNIAKVLPKQFGKHCINSQHNVFMTHALDYLSMNGWIFPPHGITTRSGRRLETGKIIELDCQNCQVVLNTTNKVGRTVDLLHFYNPKHQKTYTNPTSRIKNNYPNDIDETIKEYREIEEKKKETEFWTELKAKSNIEFWATLKETSKTKLH
jgi:hypothetical protein